MICIPNPMGAKLARGELALGVGLRGARTVEIARTMKTAGSEFACMMSGTRAQAGAVRALL